MFDKNQWRNTVKIILDTDMGPDCDDAGALALLHVLENLGEASILAVMHCTSSIWGAGCIDAINTYYKRSEIPIGTLKKSGFLVGESYNKYNRFICRNFPNKYPEGKNIPDAIKLYRSILSKQPDKNVTITAIGPLTNLAELLRSRPDEISPLSGCELINKKVRLMVAMGGNFPEGKEWNFEMDVLAAQYVTENWPTQMIFSGFEIGEKIFTGGVLEKQSPDANPVKSAYRLFTGGVSRMSWDLTAVLYAVRGLQDNWECEVSGNVTIDRLGHNKWLPDKNGRIGYLKQKKDPNQIAKELDELLGRNCVNRI